MSASSSSAAAAARAAAIKGAKPKLGEVRKDGGSSKGKEVASGEVKKRVDGSGKQISVSTQKSVKVVAKPEVKGKTSSSSSKTVTKTTKRVTVRGKTEKKVYSLSGQKYDPPEEREPLRIFYESLSKQIPSSEMAEIWSKHQCGKTTPPLVMMEHGLLSAERAKKAYERKQRKQQQARMGTPIKSPAKQERPESSKKPQAVKNGDVKAKKRVNYSDDDDDFIVQRKKLKG